LLTAFAAVAVTGCASFNSMPDPVLTRAAADRMVQPLDVATAFGAMPAQIQAGTGKAYRNKVIASYLAAADAHYLDFLRHLSRQVKGANFGLDLAALGLSSVSAIAHGAANELATGAAIATGARGSLNKEVYFEKTLPALISAMEARRLEVRAQIEKRMKEEDVGQYTLEEGFADVMRYQMATTLDGAIQELTSAAGQKEAIAAEKYKDAIDACSPPTGLDDTWAAINVRIRKPDITREKLTEIATLVKAEARDDAREQADEIMDAIERACSVDVTTATLAVLPGE
jgi:hypothetical protein